MIGSYRVEGRLGGGGMGVVFEARDTVLDRSVALKVISPHLADDPAFRARFTREAQAQASLDSPHVVHVYAHGEADGRLYIATQLIPDGDLGRMVRAHGSPPLRTALDLIGQVAAGLADAHAAGLVHRDIKPANVLLRRREEGFVAYLADFGIARQVGGDATSATTHTVGTPTYMAPELHTGGTPGVASDVYSLGCLLWATVSGAAPYGGTSDYEIVSAHLEQPVPQLDGGGPLVTEVNRILRTAMAKQPGDRYASAAAMRDQLRAAAGLPDDPDDPVDPAGAPVTGATSPRSRVLRVVGLVALLVALGVGAAVAVTSGGDEPDAQDTDPDPPATSAKFGTLTPSPPPSTPASGSAEEERAIESFASALDDQGLMSGTQSQCVARTVVQDVGLPTLVEKGFFDQHQQFLDPDLATMPEVKSALTQATLTCLT
jgi:serine/threonine-protein kinase